MNHGTYVLHAFTANPTSLHELTIDAADEKHVVAGINARLDVLVLGRCTTTKAAFINQLLQVSLLPAPGDGEAHFELPK